MKKYTLILISLFMLATTSLAFAEDDFWTEPMKIDEEAKSQEKTVTDQEFEKVLKHFKKKKSDKKKPKGQPIGPQVTEEQIQPDANAFKQTYEEYPTVMIPTTLITDKGEEIQPGYYRILAVKRDTEKFLNFYQGSSIIAKINAYETGNDHNQKSLNYTKIIPINDDIMKVIYGDIDCNLEAHVQIKQ